MTRKHITQALNIAGLTPERVLTRSDEGRSQGELWLVCGAAILTPRHGVVWTGDLELTSEAHTLTKIAHEIGQSLYVVPTDQSSPSLRPKLSDAIWWTRSSLADQDAFLSAKHYLVWHPPRRRSRAEKDHPAGKAWASNLVIFDSLELKEQFEGDCSQKVGRAIRPALLQRSGMHELVWFSNGRAILQPSFHSILARFQEPEFFEHPDKSAIHVRTEGKLKALVWPSPVPNRQTAAAACDELAVRAELAAGGGHLMAFLKQRLHPALHHGGAKELWLAVHRLLNLLEDYEACSIVWAQQGITDWKECRSICFRDVHYTFADTDVPIATLFQHFAQGQGIADFLVRYPNVAKEQVEDVLEHAALTLYS